MEAAKSIGKGKEEEEEKGRTDMVQSARSVMVRGLAPGTTVEEITIHFQRKKNNGGEVEDVTLNGQDGTAIIVFEKYNVAEKVLLKQHRIKEVNVKVEPLFKVFEKVTATVDSEAFGLTEKEMKYLLEKIKKNTSIDFHFASYGILLSGTFGQIAATRQHLQEEQNKSGYQNSLGDKYNNAESLSVQNCHQSTKPQYKKKDTFSSFDQFEEFGDEEESYETTEHFMKMFKTVYGKQLENMKKKYSVEVRQFSDTDGKRKVKIKASVETKKSELNQARKEFIALYQKAHQNSCLVRFTARDETKRNELREVVQSIVKEVPVVLEKAEDRISLQIYGQKHKVQEILVEIGHVVEIVTDDSRVYGARLPRGQSSSHFKAEEAMEVDDNDLDNQEIQYGAVKISVLKGDITDQRVDAIVNAANEFLSHGAGVAGAIIKKGGDSIQNESDQHVRHYGKVKVGNVAVTKPGRLRCKNIIHAVGPDWRVEGKEKSQKLLRMACINSLKTAEDLVLTSIAFPAISSGIFGMPKEISAQAMFAAVAEYADGKTSSKPVVNDIRFVIIDDPTVRVFREEFEFRFSELNDTPQQEDSARNTKQKQTIHKKERRPCRELYAPKTSKPQQQNLTDKTAQNKAFTHDKVSEGSSTKNNKVQSSRPLYSAAVQGPTQMSASVKEPTHERKARDGEKLPQDGQEKCAICLDDIRNPKTLNKCGHTFCRDCINGTFKKTMKTCPVCQQSYGVTVGNQPFGEMTISEDYWSLPGYEGYGKFVIDYYFPDGIQGSEHPHPGQPYRGTARRAFLPACKEGREVLHLLRKAFEARLVFTVGRSVTSGWDNQIIWNDIHHKTSEYGGPRNYGYPDPTYLSSVKEELAAKGIR